LIDPPDPAPQRALRDRAVLLAQGPAGPAVLVMLAVLEATVFPGPTEALLVALTLVRRERAVWFVVIATCASVGGGLLGYWLGHAVYADVTQPLLAAYGLTAYAETIYRVYSENMMLALVSSGYTPIPYMLYTAIAGAAELPLSGFVTGSIIGRALKYAPIVALTWYLGPRVHGVLRRYGAIAALLVAVLVVAWVIIRLVWAPST
jgi:membrane protein YqaA with SNARE-associated domain